VPNENSEADEAVRKIGYLRVSTAEQRPDRQIDGLRMICDELHIEKVSATNPHRPVYDRVLSLLRRGDQLVVWDLDRAFRSVIDALTEVEKLRKRGIEFQIATLKLDTSTPGGMFVYTMMSALAEFERRTLSQRTREGLAAARARGARLGRPPKLTEQHLQEARARLEANETLTRIAEEFGVAPWSLSRALSRTEPHDT
jgi:DNA invertase Pin-like site-specific DNA recombinase